MKRKKAWIVGISAALLGAALGAFLLLHPRASRETELLDLLPPGMDLYAAADVQSLGNSALVRTFLKDQPPSGRDEEYQQFIRNTGFHYESDLRRVALAKAGEEWVGAARVTIDRSRIQKYLESQGAEKKDASGKTVFSFGKVRPFRLVFLDDNSSDAMVAFTIGGDDARIRRVLEMRSAPSAESAASELQREGQLSHIPPPSKFWLIGNAEKILASFGNGPQVGPLGLNSGFFQGSRMLYVSIENDAAHLNLRAEDECDSPAAAGRISGTLQGILLLAQAMPGGKDKASGADLKPLLAGISIEQLQQSVLLRWQVDEAPLLRVLEAGGH